MSDFLSSFWSFYIALLTVGGILACAVLLKVMSSKRAPAGTKPELHGHVWDEDLTEYNNPLPRWWLGLFLLTVLFAAGYLVFYPGLGSNEGTLGWTSGKEAAAIYEIRQVRHLTSLLGRRCGAKPDRLISWPRSWFYTIADRPSARNR